MDELEYRDSLTHPKTVPCGRDGGILRTVYMILAETPEGGTEWLPNGCDEMDGSDACRECRQLMRASFEHWFCGGEETR